MRSRLSSDNHIRGHKPLDRLEVGFVPTMDSAPLIAAKELGLFEDYELDVRLSRQVGWATIREKLLHEELDAVAAHASVALAIHCGIGSTPRPCLTGLILSAGGSAITLSNELWDLGVRDAATAGEIIRSRKGARAFIFGVVLEFSTQHHLLYQWLLSAGVNPDKDVHIVVIPSGLIYENFSKGFLDGYCVAEPWNSAAVINKTGWVVATSGAVGLNQPEKILLVLENFAKQRANAHLRLLAALIAGCRFCEDLSKRDELIAMLAKPCYFDVPREYLKNSLIGPFDTAHGINKLDTFISFGAGTIGAPTQAAGQKVLKLVKSFGPSPKAPSCSSNIIENIFRNDIYDQATRLEQNHTKGLNTAARAQDTTSTQASSWVGVAACI